MTPFIRPEKCIQLPGIGQEIRQIDASSLTLVPEASPPDSSLQSQDTGIKNKTRRKEIVHATQSQSQSVAVLKYETRPLTSLQTKRPHEAASSIKWTKEADERKKASGSSVTTASSSSSRRRYLFSSPFLTARRVFHLFFLYHQSKQNDNNSSSEITSLSGGNLSECEKNICVPRNR